MACFDTLQKYLVNGRSITQCAPEGAAIIDYLHIELFAHDVIYAEGATAETFGSLRGLGTTSTTSHEL